MSSNLRQILQDCLHPLPNNITVGTSVGIDSASLVLSALDIGKQVSIISFTLEDRRSKDFLGAKKLADIFDLQFIPIFIPTNSNEIFKTVIHIVRTLTAAETKYDIKLRKTTIECILPWLFVFEVMAKHQLSNLVTGLSADGHFGLSKKAMIHYKEPKQKFQQFRSEYFSKPDVAQTKSLPLFGLRYGVNVLSPYFNKEVFDLYVDAEWSQLNKPRQKEAIRKEFPTLDGICENKHTNYQLGDSGIAELVGKVVKERVAPQAKSPIKAYNILEKRGRAGLL
jgi:hypothetical protein